MNKKLSQLLNPKKRIAGLDIGTSFIKFMEIEGDNLKDCRIVNYAVELIPKDYISQDGKFTNIEGMSDLIKNCWKRSGSSVKNVAISLQTAGVIYKKVMIANFDNEEDLKMQIDSEIIRYFPDNMSLEEVSIDYYNIGPNAENPTENDMILIAAKKQAIDDKKAIVDMSGLNTLIIDVEHYTTQNMLRFMLGEEFNSKTVLLLDCSANTLRMLAFKNGELIYIKDNQMGGDDLSKSISSNLGILNQLEIENLKVEGRNDESYKTIEKTFLNDYAAEFIRAFQYFITVSNVTQVDEVIITGGVGNMVGIEQAFKKVISEYNEQHIKKDPYVARISEMFSKSNKVSLTKLAREESGLFMVASLALRQFMRQY